MVYYRIKKSCLVTYTKQDIIDCWIHQTKSWSDLIPVKNFDDDNNHNGKQINLTNSCREKNHYVLEYVFLYML